MTITCSKCHSCRDVLFCNFQTLQVTIRSIHFFQISGLLAAIKWMNVLAKSRRKLIYEAHFVCVCVCVGERAARSRACICVRVLVC